MTGFFQKLFAAGAPEKPDGLVRAYGKLPMYAEYRRLEVSPGAPTAFTQWLDAGRLAWARSPTKTDRAATRPSRMLIRLPDQKEVVVASIWDSRDSLGRVFPFCFFVVAMPESLGADPIERWAAALQIHESFDHLYAELCSLGSGGDFYRHYQKRTIPLRSPDLPERLRQLRQQAAKITPSEWLKGAQLDGQAGGAPWLIGLQRRGERWRESPTSLGEVAVSCPLAEGWSYGAQSILWLQWLGPLLAKTGIQPGIIVPGHEAKGPSAVHLLLRGLLPDDFQLATTDDGAYAFIERLDKLAPVDGADPAVVPALPAGALLDWFSANAPTPA